MPTKTYYLVSILTDWADEMTIEGHRVMTENKFTAWKKELDTTEFPISVNFGTNQDGEVFENEIKIKKIELTNTGYTNLFDTDFLQEIKLDDKEWDEEE